MSYSVQDSAKLLESKYSAVLALHNGKIFWGDKFGFNSEFHTAELVFNTSHHGYQEITTDPSYQGQIVLFCYPHIGNVGCNQYDNESNIKACTGVVAKSFEPASNYRSEQEFEDFLIAHKIPAIQSVDTRALVHICTKEGSPAACIAHFDAKIPQAKKDTIAKQAIAYALEFYAKQNDNLAPEASDPNLTQTPWQQIPHQLDFLTANSNRPTAEVQATKQLKVVSFDCGIKHNILRLLTQQAAEVTVLDYHSTITDIKNTNPDLIVLSNGPGDPFKAEHAIELCKHLIDTDIPILAICFGHQLLAQAAGAKVFKLKFGHHGANHPIRCEQSGRIFITSQNHNFAIEKDSLPDSWQVSHTSLFDNTVQGISHKHKLIRSYQGHPEASPGPHDMHNIFHDFFLQLNHINAQKH